MNIKYRVHAVKRMFERGINENEVEFIISNGKVIREYLNDEPYPTKLILGYIQNRPIHLVIAENKKDNELIIITVYEPDPLKWDSSYERKI